MQRSRQLFSMKYLALAIAAALLGPLVFFKGTAHAYDKVDKDRCFDTTHEVGVVIFVAIYDHNDNFVGYSNSFDFKVDNNIDSDSDPDLKRNAHNSVISWNGGIKKAYGQLATTSLSVRPTTPYGQGNRCDPTPSGDGSKVNAYAFRSGDGTNRRVPNAGESDKSIYQNSGRYPKRSWECIKQDRHRDETKKNGVWGSWSGWGADCGDYGWVYKSWVYNKTPSINDNGWSCSKSPAGDPSNNSVKEKQVQTCVYGDDLQAHDVGYTDGSPNPGWENNGSLSLSCLGVASVKFIFTPTANYDTSYGAQGGSFTGSTTERKKNPDNLTFDSSIAQTIKSSDKTEDLNGQQFTVIFKYKLKAPPVPNALTADAQLNAGELEPGEQVTAKALVTSNPGASTSGSNYDRYFWYEKAGDASRYGPGDELIQKKEDGSATYSGATTNFSDWGPIIVKDGATRVCTSLKLKGPLTNATLADDFDSDCADVSTRYFFQVINGDVNAAACFADCTSSPTISAFNSGSATSYRGSGGQIAAFATGKIDGFTSASMGSFTAPAPKQLTFANSGSADANSAYGGGFTSRYQLTNYWTDLKPGNAVVDSSSGLIVKTAGDARITLSGASRKVTTVGVGNVPNLQWVIADGDIYIDSDVTDLDGVFIAKGNIYTCGTGFSAIHVGSAMATQCTKPLTIHGALVAGGSVKLQRVRDGGGLKSGQPSEIIDYNPFVWMQSINTNPSTPLPTISSGKLDFMTTLPPIL